MAVAIGSWTTTLRAAVHVYGNDFRHPRMLAKELSTIAMLTEGRFDAGIGAGWMKADYETLGIPFDEPLDRIRRLRETVRIVKDSWAEGAPAPTLVMGGGGPTMLTIAAQEADIVSINVRLASGKLGPERGASATVEATRKKVQTVREAAGPRWTDLTLQIEQHFVEVTSSKEDALERAARTLGLPPEEAGRSPHVLLGSKEEICDRLFELREQFGVSYICMSGAHAEEFAPVVAAMAGR